MVGFATDAVVFAWAVVPAEVAAASTIHILGSPPYLLPSSTHGKNFKNSVSCSDLVNDPKSWETSVLVHMIV